MQVAVETLTTREKRRDLGSAVFEQSKVSMAHVVMSVAGSTGTWDGDFAAPGYASFPLPRV